MYKNIKKLLWLMVCIIFIINLTGCGTQPEQTQKVDNYENETLGFSFEIPSAWGEDFEVQERTEGTITYIDFLYPYGWPQKKTTLLVSIIATDEATWTSQQLENDYYLMAVNKEGVFFANRVPLVPEEVPFKEGSKKAKEFQARLISLQEVAKRFSVTR